MQRSVRHGRELWLCEHEHHTAAIPVWMTDPVACAGLSVGPLLVSVDALTELTSLVDATRSAHDRVNYLESRRTSFAFESTLASQMLSRRLKRLTELGYTVHLVYLWLPSVDLALARVAERVRAGGHDVPAEAVRRRFERGRHNFFTTFRRLATTWRLYDASSLRGPRLIASGGSGRPTRILDPEIWGQAAHGYDNE